MIEVHLVDGPHKGRALTVTPCEVIRVPVFETKPRDVTRADEHPTATIQVAEYRVRPIVAQGTVVGYTGHYISQACPEDAEVDIVFDRLPGPDGTVFIDVESPPGTSVQFGRWVPRDDGYAALRFTYKANPGGANLPEGFTPVRTETLKWLLGEGGDFEPPEWQREQNERVYGKIAPYWWRHHLRDAMLTVKPEPAGDWVRCRRETAAIALEALEFYAAERFKGFGNDPEPIEHHWAQEAISEIWPLIPQPPKREGS